MPRRLLIYLMYLQLPYFFRNFGRCQGPGSQKYTLCQRLTNSIQRRCGILRDVAAACN